MTRYLFLAIALLATSLRLSADDLATGFVDPPLVARPHTWWHWMHGHVTKEGITADLEAMKQAGLGGAQAFHISTGIPAGPVKYMSPEWRALMSHTVREADRLGLKLCVHNCAGWSSSGGPWVTPDNSTFEIVWTESRVDGEDSVIRIEQPLERLDYYRDIAILAFPTPPIEMRGEPGFRLEQFRGKAGFDRLDDPHHDPRPAPEGAVIAHDSIVDLTSKLRADGTLQWKPPAGDWTLIRFGYTPTMRTNAPAPDEGRGLECDKLSAAGADQHWQGMVQKVLDDVGPLAGPTLDNILIDSYETGQQNWTHDFAREFRERRKYDPISYLPTVTGRVVENVEISERFLWDFRRTIADLFRDKYYGRFAELCHERNLKLSIEPYGGWTGNFHDVEVASMADIPMGEFWAHRPADWCSWSIKLAASAAHANGRAIVGAESFTSAPDQAMWRNHPGNLKAQGDHAFSQGLNRVIFHTCVHQPWPSTIQPGMTMSEYGMQLNRNNTWFFQGRAWMDYLARCQYLLQQGRCVADVCYVWNENAPNRMRRRDELVPTPPAGYDYDALTTQLMMSLKVVDGRLVLPSGMEYGALVLSDDETIRPEVLEKIKELRAAGAAIIGRRPNASPSLQDYPNCDEQVRRLASQLWDAGGIAADAESLAESLKSKGLLPDFELLNGAAESPLEYIHRRVGKLDLYFVTNQGDTTVQSDCQFRVAGARPEFWRPETGSREPAPLWWASDDGRTVVNLALKPAESVFVVFQPEQSALPHAISARGPKSQLSQAISRPKVAIIQATYGALKGNKSQQVDVTQAVKDLVSQNVYKFSADNNLAGDPAFEVVKQLRVKYTLEGATLTKTVPENSAFSFVETASLEPLPPSSQLAIVGDRLRLISFVEGEYLVELQNGKNVQKQIARLPLPLKVRGPWSVDLAPHQGYASDLPTIRLEQLASLSEQRNDDVRYFAGTATYRTTFQVDATRLGASKQHRLNLGRVEVIAHVELNGKSLGVLWKSPYDIDVSPLLQAGKNELVVKVTTLLPNRLIGDERQSATPSTTRGLRDEVIPQWVASGKRPTETKTYSTWRHWLAADELIPSGLIGPVVIYTGESLPIEN